MSDLKVAVSTFPFLYSHRGIDALKHCAGLGFSAFEMMIFPPHCWPVEMSASDRAEVKTWMDGEGHTFSSFCYPLLDNNPNGVDKLMRQYTLDRYREALDLAVEWKCPYVVAIPGPVNSLINPPYQWMRDWFVEGVKELVDHTKGSGVEILLENVPFTFLPTTQDMIDVAKDIDPSVGVNFDVCNAAYIKESVPDAIRALGPLCKNVHISDSGFGEFKHDKLGTGIVEVAPAAAALKEIGYEGYTILEIIADKMIEGTDPEGDIAESAAILARNGFEAVTPKA